MRWIVASLIFTNVVALLVQLAMPHWGLSRGEEVVAGHAPAIPDKRAGRSLQLLAELDDAARQAMVSDKQRLRQATAVAVTSQPLCTMAGPFAELLRAEYFVERLAALDVSSSIEDVEVPGDVAYWIYLPPRESRKQAFSELRELQAKGIDSYVIPKGELANGISFGMFSRADLASNRLKDMRSQGYAAELKEITRSHKETWVVLAPGQAKRLSQETWQAMLADEENAERRQNFCPPVAS